MRWVITEHVHYDRVASPWLVTRFVDPAAEFSFVPSGLSVDELSAEQLPPGAIPLAIPGARLGPHDDQGPLFVKILREYNLEEPALVAMGEVVTLGVDYVLHGFRPAADDRYGQMAVGLLSFSEGMMIIEPSDGERLKRSYVVWDSIHALLTANSERG